LVSRQKQESNIMRVFVTGATGWVGSAVVDDLIEHGHEVLGLTRSDKGAQQLEAAGAQVHHGSLDDLNSLAQGASQADAVVHTAFNHDFSKFAENCEQERRAIEAIGNALEGSKRPLIVTSGVALLTPGRVSTEDEVARAHDPAFPRAPEASAIALAQRGVPTTSVRLAPTTHGIGDHGFVPILIALAREKGVAAYVGDGANRWPAVHRLDAARIYRLALERGVEGGPFHAIAEEGVPFRQIAEAIGRGLNVPVKSLSADEAAAHFGWFARFAGIDCPSSSARTQRYLDWIPNQPTLLEDLARPEYFSVQD
jgi:nucleoside-diphosphate-sugar epimerase